MYRLVIVDDEPHILEGLKNLYPWENLGFEVTATFQNGRDALDYINTHGHIDVVMTDIQMPVLSGVELAQNLRDSNTIVIFSAPIRISPMPGPPSSTMSWTT